MHPGLQCSSRGTRTEYLDWWPFILCVSFYLLGHACRVGPVGSVIGIRGLCRVLVDSFVRQFCRLNIVFRQLDQNGYEDVSRARNVFNVKTPRA